MPQTTKRSFLLRPYFLVGLFLLGVIQSPELRACTTSVFTFTCESDIEVLQYGLSTNTVDYYEGSKSCTTSTSGRFSFSLSTPVPINGITYSLIIYTDKNSSHDAQIHTTLGTFNMQLESSVSVIGADGNRWREQTYTYTHAALSIGLIHSFSIDMKRNDHVDFLTFNATTGIDDEVYFTLRLPQNTSVIISGSEEIGDEFHRTLNTTWEGRFKSNDEVLVSFVPIAEDPKLSLICDNLNLVAISPDPTEAGGDSFSIQCEFGLGELSDQKFFKITNNTTKRYCLPVTFSIDIDYFINFSEETTSGSFNEVFDIRSLFL